MSARLARTTSVEQSDARGPRRYALRIRTAIIIGSTAGLWALLVLAAWLLYRASI